MRIINLFKDEINCYRSIDELPLWNWNKIHETNDFGYMLKHGTHYHANQKNFLIECFNQCYKEYIDSFGINENLVKVLMLKRDIAVLQADMLLTGDLSKQTFIDIKLQELHDFFKEGEKASQHSIKAIVEKYMGFRVDEKTITVKEFYSYCELLKNEIENKPKKDLNNE